MIPAEPGADEALTPTRPSARTNAILDVVGLSIAAGLIGWIFVAASASGGAPGAATALVLGCALAYILGRILGSVGPTITPTLVVVSALVLASVSIDETLSATPLGGPFGYVNAKAAFFVQAVFASLMLAVLTKAIGVRALAVAAAIAFALVPFVSHSWSAALVVLSLPIIAVVLSRSGARIAIVGCVSVFILVFLITAILGGSYSASSDRSGPIAVLAHDTLTERRLELWNEALDLMISHPVTGVGPDRFQAVSEIAQSDSDARWAHNEFFQVGAEAGIVGLVLLLSLYLWPFARLWTEAGKPSLTALAAGSLAALGVHACLDYVAHFPAIPLVAAALTGSATASAGARLNGPHRSPDPPPRNRAAASG